MQNEWYKEKYIKRKNKVRKIITYNDESVREKHSQINRILNEKLMFSKFSKAYIKGTSIFYNAKSHMYNDIFICIDIKRFLIILIIKFYSKRFIMSLIKLKKM